MCTSRRSSSSCQVQSLSQFPKCIFLFWIFHHACISGILAKHSTGVGGRFWLDPLFSTIVMLLESFGWIRKIGPMGNTSIVIAPRWLGLPNPNPGFLQYFRKLTYYCDDVGIFKSRDVSMVTELKSSIICSTVHLCSPKRTMVRLFLYSWNSAAQILHIQ